MVTSSFWFIRDAILVGFITKYGSQQAIKRSVGCGLLFVTVDVALRHFFSSADSSGENQLDPIASFQVLLRVLLE